MEADRTRQRYAGRTALVLGASGFIGRWVVRGLEAEGARVVPAVRKPAAARAIFSTWGIRAEPRSLEVTDPDAIRDLLHRVRPAITFNLAGYGVDRTEQDEQLAWRINDALLATLAPAVAATRDPAWPGLHLVHTGSALEYGAIGGNLSEDASPNPTTVYGRSKLAGTTTLARCSAELGIGSVTARLFTVYGPGEHPGRLLPTLLDIAATGTPKDLTEGLQKRDFTYVEDVVEGLLALGRSAKLSGEVVNLATGKLATVREFIEVAARILRIPPANLRFGALPTRPEEMEHAAVAVDRLGGLLGWTPGTDIATGIQKTLDFQSGHRT